LSLRLLTVVGARPQFIKAVMVSRAVRDAEGVDETLVHTGQHFDANMSDVFFSELEMAPPDHNLGIGGGTHAQNTGRMLEAIERVLSELRPDWVVVYGDTDSTIAGALAAAKLQIPVAHVEAGLRSFNRAMPEEINRVLTDHASTALFAPTIAAESNLRAEGIGGAKVRRVGDVMYDAAIYFGEKAQRTSAVLVRLGLRAGEFVLLTLHRPSNTDDRSRLAAILRSAASAPHPVVWPVHPRARQRLTEFGLEVPAKVLAIEPVGYLDMVMLERSARLIATDSGGVQKEAYFHRVPCATLRNETEWVELVEIGANHLVGADLSRFSELLACPPAFPSRADALGLYGDGHAAEAILAALRHWNATES